MFMCQAMKTNIALGIKVDLVIMSIILFYNLDIVCSIMRTGLQEFLLECIKHLYVIK